MMSSSTPSTSEELSFSILSAIDETSEKNSEIWQTAPMQVPRNSCAEAPDLCSSPGLRCYSIPLESRSSLVTTYGSYDAYMPKEMKQTSSPIISCAAEPLLTTTGMPTRQILRRHSKHSNQ